MKKTILILGINIVLACGAGLYMWKHPAVAIKLNNFWSGFLSGDSKPGPDLNVQPAPAAATDPVAVMSTSDIRTLLKSKKFEKLNAILEGYKKTLSKDDFIVISRVYFEIDDPRLEDAFNGWADRFPTDYQPYLARGIYYFKKGLESRGGRWASETSAAQFAGMERYYAMANKDFEKALNLKKDITVPCYYFIRIKRSSSDDIITEGMPQILAKGLAIDPSSFILRSVYLLSITPRWGGSYEEMDTFARDSQKYAPANPKMAALMGYAFYDAGDMKMINGDYTAALSLLNKALTYYELPMFLYKRAEIYTKMGKNAEALKDLNRVHDLDPSETDPDFPH